MIKSINSPIINQLYIGDSKFTNQNEGATNKEQFLSSCQAMQNFEILSLYSKCAKSNAIKNIINQFQNFILCSDDQIVVESISELIEQRNLSQIRKEFNTFCKLKKLNQSFLVSVINSKRFSMFFKYFLNYYVLDWAFERVNKELNNHLICIIFFQRCFLDKTLIKEIKTYKKRLD
ncbi:hypothetical protein TTHERM_00181130 (macronuclear) [Tetrahymena thermophila SB210]|uniref:Uncharacterized protein n=1 Tax=Tetrahymena thermophila (strain SB210) TaxID=312017 RepID=Q22TA3_TETTS|nr:hypothetical protein TTHERM_00181130 [Tetrahymena thermophila SB210]EAR88535.1 hypothetical protein TTHERM_00181130 [Tetrahymena thermophila SB210]|eukprot:XP_001008780.1 hypothetical protein TTHERM_00181130 [Tetrahymena thermophila SB210]